MPKTNGAIAILGGMGPEASAKMLEVMVSMAAREFGAKDGEDFPEIIVDSIPVADFISNKKKMASALKILKSRVIQLNNFEISNFGIACNTAHLLFDELKGSSDGKFVSMIDEVVEQVRKDGIKIVGLLATPSAINADLYQRVLNNHNIEVILPDKRQMLTLEKTIRRVIALKNSNVDTKKVVKIANSFKKKGAQGVILGCTELPIVFPKNFPLPVFDSVEILSRKLLKNFFNGKKNGRTI